MLHEAIFPATCNATNVALQVAITIACNTLFSQLAMQQNVALQVARKVELSSTFHNVARQVAACNKSSATCNVFIFVIVVLQFAEKLPRVTWPLRIPST